MLRLRWSCAAGALILAFAVSRPAAAQAPSPAAAAAPTMSFAPTLTATHLAFPAEDQASLTVNAAATRMDRREGRILAIVGGAGLGLYGLCIWQR
jgi:hypothetical protein